jgi:hypothetical protein
MLLSDVFEKSFPPFIIATQGETIQN